MQQNLPRLILAGTNSGCGKTTVTCAVLQALVNRGLSVAAAKCGPDYIDPMFHSRIIGAKSSNLDPFFFDENTLRFLLAQNASGCDVTVIEGVMGYYDGLGLTSTRASTYELAQKTVSPVVLVVNARGAALSVLASVRGFLDFLPESEALSAKKLLASPNLIILKAFTKLYGMAGVRLGYCLCSNTALLEKMQTAGQPWAVSSLAQAAGLAALDETAYVAQVRALIAQQRPRLTAGLRALGLRVLDGRANYLLFQGPETLGDALRQRGIVLRGCGNYPGLDSSWYRTAVRTGPENDELLKTLAEVLA